VSSAPASTSDTVALRLAAGRDILDNGGAQFAVQLVTADARERAYLGGYLTEAAQSLSAGKVFVAPAGTPDAPRYGVLYGPFRARAEALDALGALPVSLKQFGPYVRSLDAIRDDARRAGRT
jgi:septal ring-binding cell division protein DamX